jgi:hypothetical protein
MLILGVETRISEWRRGEREMTYHVCVRVAIGLLLFSLSGRSLVSAEEGELRKLEETKRIFELRRALDQFLAMGSLHVTTAR